MVVNPTSTGGNTTVVVINADEDVPPIDSWLEVVATREPVDLSMSAAEFLREARDAGEA